MPYLGNSPGSSGEANVQVDWSQTTTTEDDFIKSKPTTITTTQASAITANTTHSGSTSNPHSVTATQVGLGNVDNTSDASKPVSTAQATADALALPIAGGTMTGPTAHGDNVKSTYGTGGSNSKLEIYSSGADSYIVDTGAGDLIIRTSNELRLQDGNQKNYIYGKEGEYTRIYYDGVEKLATTSTGITVTGTAVATTNTDTTNAGSITLDFGTNQNFVLTLTDDVTLANPSTEQVGQSGFIAFIQDGTGSRIVSLGTDYETAAAAGLTLTSTPSATDLVPYLVVASNRILLGTPQLAFA